MPHQVVVGGKALTLEEAGEPERTQEYTDALGSSLAVYYKLQKAASALEWEIEVAKRGILSGARMQMRGPKGFAGDVHLLEVLDAVKALHKQIPELRAQLVEVKLLDPTDAWEVINAIGMEHLDDEGNLRQA